MSGAFTTEKNQIKAMSINGVIVMFCSINYLPLILFVLMLILSLMYKMDKERPQMTADLGRTG